MADRGGEVQVITLGGKGSSLSSSSVHAIAAGQALVRIDSSALVRLSLQDPPPQSLKKCGIPIPKTLTPIESRACIVVLVNKLLRHNKPSEIRAALPSLIADLLNSVSDVASGLESVAVTDGEALVVKNSCAELYGVAAIIEHEAAALATVVDAVAALSCEALEGKTAAFNSTDAGDGLVDKDEIGVASGMKALLAGSEMAGKVPREAISEIPRVHGGLRQFVKSAHSMTRVGLNSAVKTEVGGESEAVGVELQQLVVGGERKAVGLKLSQFTALRDVGDSSLSRAKLNVEAVGIESARNGLVCLLEKKCPTEADLMNADKLVYDLLWGKDYSVFVHALYSLLEVVWSIVSWELVTAFVVLEGGELEGGKIREVNGGDKPWDKKIEKKKKHNDVIVQLYKERFQRKEAESSDGQTVLEKCVDKKSEKKKSVPGKGTGVIVQLIKERLQRKEGESSDGQTVLEKWVDDLLLLIDHKRPQFGELVSKVKEIVDSNGSRRVPKLPKGTRDFSKEQMAVREKAFSIVAGVFKRHGATALDTPVFELRETLMGKYGEDSKLVYDLADQGGELCSLRYDLTVPFARFMAMHRFTSYKRFQIAKVYRRDNPAKGRYREFYQCDFDIAGQNGRMGPDFEVIKVLTELLDELDIGDYEVKLNHRKLLDGMLEICGVPPEKFRTICSSIDKLDKQSFGQVKKEMVEEKGLSEATADKLGRFLKEKGSPKELLAKHKREGSGFLLNASSKQALDELEILFEALDRSKCVSKVVFDLSLARGLDYYTGVIFEAVVKGATEVGSIAAGGRYDNLIGMFGPDQVPAVGVSLGIERVLVIMEQLEKDRETVRPTETQVQLSILGDKSKQLPLAAELAGELWDGKVKSEYMIHKRFQALLEKAMASEIPWMVIVGDKELERGIVKLKNVKTKAEEEVPRATFVQEVQRRLKE